MSPLLSYLRETARKALSPPRPNLAQALSRLGKGDSDCSANGHHRLQSSLLAGSGVGRVDAVSRPTVGPALPLAARRLKEEAARLRCRGINFVYQETLLIDYLLAECEDFQSGAQRVAEVVDRKLLRPISALLLGYDPAAKVRIELDDRFLAGGSPWMLPETP
jgi:hypothetical protein